MSYTWCLAEVRPDDSLCYFHPDSWDDPSGSPGKPSELARVQPSCTSSNIVLVFPWDVNSSAELISLSAIAFKWADVLRQTEAKVSSHPLGLHFFHIIPGESSLKRQDFCVFNLMCLLTYLGLFFKAVLPPSYFTAVKISHFMIYGKKTIPISIY